MKEATIGFSKRTAFLAALLGAATLIVGLISVLAMNNSHKARWIKGGRSSGAFNGAASQPQSVRSGARILLGEEDKRIVPDSDKLSLDEARRDTAVKFQIPKALPTGAKLEMIFRVGLQSKGGGEDKRTISQRYDVNGKYLEIWASPMAKAPDYKRIADEGAVKVAGQNSDGSIKFQSDGSVKMVKADGTKFVTVNGLPGIASEPNKVKSHSFGIVNNPGVLSWYANGTEYQIWGEDMPVSELIKIAESMAN